MGAKKRLPVGIEFFDELIRENFYYIDKTGLIEELLNNWGKVNLFTRPRRFGKSLNMSMLKTFFERGCDPSIFEGLKISHNVKLCEQYMGQFPVISISMKGVDGRTFEAACTALKGIIGTEAMRFQFLEDSKILSQKEKELYRQIIRIDEKNLDVYAMSEGILQQSLLNLSALLAKHYGRQVILLIDEYDVPLDKAFQYGYYDEMVSLVRNLFGNVLKTNPNLYFAVLTGCLRVSKESIFTGLNNFKVLTITDVRFDEYFGFTDADVRGILEYYGLMQKYDAVRSWYDGYQFGKVDIYCPWDVISYCDKLCSDPNAQPEDYWSNTSGNAIVRRFIDKANLQTRSEIEQLIEGREIIKEIHPELTYNELDANIENLWSVLFTTGYLTQNGNDDKGLYKLVIPNKEVREVFILQIRDWFTRVVANEHASTEKINCGFLEGKAEEIQKELIPEIIREIESSEKFEALLEQHGDFVQLMSQICDQYKYLLEYDFDFSLKEYLKHYKVTLADLEGSALEKLLEYIPVVQELTGKTVFFLHGYGDYLSENDFKHLQKWAKYQEYYIVFLGSRQLLLKENTNEYIIDSDLCEIH